MECEYLSHRKNIKIVTKGDFTYHTDIPTQKAAIKEARRTYGELRGDNGNCRKKTEADTT